MKKTVALFLVFVVALGCVGCGKKQVLTTVGTQEQSISEEQGNGEPEESTTEPKSTEPEQIATPEHPVDLEVVTTFAGNDGNTQNYIEFSKIWEEKTGNTVVDKSAVSDESFKTKIINDFATDSEPDVLFFFNGADANSFIEAGKVVPLSEIKEEYPDFASNIDLNRVPTSMVDNEIYAIPANGYWEALFVNNTVLEAAGVETPGADYTWEKFLEDCEKIKKAGYTPIAAALGNVPHYWWEFSIFNHTSPKNHMTIPDSVDGEIGEAWVEGMEDIKTLYELGYFPEITNSASDEITFSMFVEGQAAFLVDGSWRAGGIVRNCQTDPDDPGTLDEEKLSQFSVTFVPGTEQRKTTDLIGGISMGYYISRKAWEDPDTRAAAVSYVSYMTSDEVASVFTQHTINALKNAPVVKTEDYNSLQIKAMDMLAQCTSLTGAVQDVFQGDCRVSTFDDMPKIVTGQVSPRDAVAESLRIYQEQH